MRHNVSTGAGEPMPNSMFAATAYAVSVSSGVGYSDLQRAKAIVDVAAHQNERCEICLSNLCVSVNWEGSS